MTIQNIAIVGGTHGNEFTGSYLAKFWQKNPKLVKRNGFKTKVIFANEKAFKNVSRYIDIDLNRACSITDINNPSKNSHEDKLAQELNSKLGPKDDKNKNCDFVIDLHTTTANMGLSLVVSDESELTWLSVSYLAKEFKELKVYRWLGDKEDGYVSSLGSAGFAIEVGAIPQGVLRADLYLKTQKLVYKLLDFFEKFEELKDSVKREVSIYDHVALVDYPRDASSELKAMVHKNRQDRDFQKIKEGEPIFMTFDGKTINYEGKEELYTLFINEAAYYEKGFAMCLAKKIEHKF
jgi:aspartoacylase